MPLKPMPENVKTSRRIAIISRDAFLRQKKIRKPDDLRIYSDRHFLPALVFNSNDDNRLVHNRFYF
jgi:hypothetical protein